MLFLLVTALPAVQSWIRKYRYVRTTLVALHNNVLHLPIRRYRWLKGLDRTLWYALASTGRPWPFVEDAGVASQSQWETLVAHYQVRLNCPIMTLVIDGLDTDLRNIGAVVDAPSTTSPSSSDEQEEEDGEDNVSSLMNNIFTAIPPLIAPK